MFCWEAKTASCIAAALDPENLAQGLMFCQDRQWIKNCFHGHETHCVFKLPKLFGRPAVPMCSADTAAGNDSEESYSELSILVESDWQD
jgi:hypothetical protein